MFFQGIIITGTSGAGKSTIAQKLCEPDEGEETSFFEVVKAITTRPQRVDDFNYDFVTMSEFDELLSNKALLTHATYRGQKYGIKFSDYNFLLNENKTPILVLAPEAAVTLLENYDGMFMCFFVDVCDDVQINRLQTRSANILTNVEIDLLKKQNQSDRKDAYKSNYVLKNNSLETTLSLIKHLWEYRNCGGGLPYKTIRLMIECGMLLERAEISGIKGASYDLLLGDEYYYAGNIKKLSDANPFLTIEPYDYAIVSSKEIACMPRDVTGKFGLTVGLFCQGIILSNGPQVDPGFRGTLFCLLFNTSNRAVHLIRGKHYATIEFNKLIEPAQPYQGKYQNTEKIINYIPPNALQGAINELKIEIEKLKNESKLMQNIYLGVVGLMFAIISIILVLR